MIFKNTSQYPTTDVKPLVEFACQDVDMDKVAVIIKSATKGAYRGRAYGYVPITSKWALDQGARFLMTVSIGPQSRFPVTNIKGTTRWLKRGTSKEQALDVLSRCRNNWKPAQLTWRIWYYTGHTKPDERQYGITTYAPYGGHFAQMDTWDEALVKVAAHEARHIWQFKNRLDARETDAQKFAVQRLEKYRKEY